MDLVIISSVFLPILKNPYFVFHIAQYSDYNSALCYMAYGPAFQLPVG